MSRPSLTIISYCCFLFSTVGYTAPTPDPGPLSEEHIRAEHERGVQLARDKKIDAGLKALADLLAKAPEDYPTRRDYAIIATWKPDCDLALQQYDVIKNRTNQEAYLIAPIAECKSQLRDHDGALAMLRQGIKQYPDDEEIRNVYKNILREQALDSRSRLDMSVSTSESSEDSREWTFQTRYSQEITNRLRAYIRFLRKWADDADFETGDFNRVGIGALFDISPRFLLDQEFSKEVHHNEREGSRTALHFYPNSRWHVMGEYATFAEDISLRADAINVEAERATISADYHTYNYLWEWSGGISYYDFSDTNDRTSLFTGVGYGIELTPKREQRVSLDYYRVDNSLGSTVVYYNPEVGQSLTLTHKTSWVIDSDWQRRVDHLSVFVGMMDQSNTKSKPIWGARYEQNYDVNDFNSLSWGIEWASRVYDGGRESQIAAHAAMSTKF